MNEFKPSLGLLDATMLVAGNMIGSGIFIVSADMTRHVGSPGWLILAWVLTGFMTLAAALSYGELGALFPRAGGQYVYLKEAYNPLVGFLYGWSFFSVIQTATIAAVGVAFAKFAAYLVPAFSEDKVLFFHVSPAQLLAIAVIVLLTVVNTRGIRNGKLIQTTVTIAKLLALGGLIVFGLVLVRGSVWKANWADPWSLHQLLPSGTAPSYGLLAGLGAMAAAMVGSVFSSDSWHNMTMVAGEIRNPQKNIARALGLGVGIVTLIYVSANLMYTGVLPMRDMAFAEKDRVAVTAANVIFGQAGTVLIALLIMVSTFGCNNGLILAGARVYYTMAEDGLFFRKIGTLNRHAVPSVALWLQCIIASAWCLSGKYGDLLDMISFVVVGFYMLTIVGLFRLRRLRPDAPRSYKALGYPVLPLLYIVMGLAFCVLLIVFKPRFTWPGLLITLAGIPLYYLVLLVRKARAGVVVTLLLALGPAFAHGQSVSPTAGRAGSGAKPDATAIRDYPIRPVPFTQVHVDDAFWAPKLQVSREVTIPYVLHMCEVHGRLANFRAAALHNGARLTVYPFDDTDVYKAIEGASYSLQVHPDPKLERYLDTLIALIGSAQEPDGYLYTFRSADEAHPHEWIGSKRWEKEEILSHELYDAGHLYESAVAHFQATGKRNFLDIALKNADLLCRTFGYGKLVKYPGHQIVEIGLVKLYRVTGERKYLDLAKFFLDVRGGGDSYNQADRPVIDQHEAEGHAVRAGYMYTGMADVAALTGDTAYERAIDDIWTDVVSHKLYITGGIGSTSDGEAFGAPYDLPNLSAYAETCASVANIFWNSRMFLLHGDSRYIDVLERTLYNGLLSGVSLSGNRFFYPNPLASVGQQQRSAWFDCACCITNIARFMPSVPGYVYARKGNQVYVNLFIGSRATVHLTDGVLPLVQRTDYPWGGKVSVELDPAAPMRAGLRVRIPGWVEERPIASMLYFDAGASEAGSIPIYVNGRRADYRLDQGYAVLERTWRKGDVVTLDFPMPVQKVLANALVGADDGRFAFQRGPIVYCLEGPDNAGRKVRNILVDSSAVPTVRRDTILGGIETIETQGLALAHERGDTGLVRTSETVTAIPYYTWANRGPSEMTVWIPYETSSANPIPVPTIASRSRVSSSIGQPRMLRSINDLYDPLNSDDHTMPYFHWWPRKDTDEWVEYDFDSTYTVSASKVYWFDDGPDGGCRIPASWELFYDQGGTWVPVPALSPYEVVKDKYCTVRFTPVQTAKLRLVVRLPKEYSAGIHEWTVE